MPIPDTVRDIYRLWRPAPLYRAHRLEQALGTPAHIYYKYEGVSPAGSHKPNTAVPQAWYNAQAGVRRLTTETGAGQWGSSLAMAGQMLGVEVRVYMVRVSYDQKPHRRSMMHTWGAEVIASPSPHTAAGRAVLDSHPDSPGALGIAISEAVEEAAGRADTNYALGSVLNHVMLHQTVIGLEAKQQMVLAGDYPDVVIAPCGGGSNFAGLAFPFVADKAAGRQVRLLAVEPASCPTLTRGAYAHDYGDTAGLTPIMRMYTLGHDFVPPSIHAGGLRYHGSAPLVAQLVHDGIVEARAVPQLATFEAGVLFARSEGIIPAPESNHAIRAAIDEALEAKQVGEPRVILSTCPATAISTWPPTTATSPANCVITTTRTRPSRMRWGVCRRWANKETAEKSAAPRRSAECTRRPEARYKAFTGRVPVRAERWPGPAVTQSPGPRGQPSETP